MTALREHGNWTYERIERALRQFLAGRPEWPRYRDFQSAGKKGLRDAVTHGGGAEAWAQRLGVAYPIRRPGYGPVWTEKRVREDLRAFLAGRTTWPHRREFDDAGLAPLRNAVNRLGGAERWAREFGLSEPDRRAGRRRRWTEDEIEAAARPLIERTGRWPSRAEFAAAGIESALCAMYRYEGINVWRRRFGFEPPDPPRAPTWRRWTDDRIERELRQFCAGRDHWPTESEFNAAGLRTLYHAASDHGGVDSWKRRLGLASSRITSDAPRRGRGRTRSAPRPASRR
jgi:hypothetical protein